MLRFFHNIRKSTLMSNHISKYLAYAIGETLLVVLGILIALQVNNWNENRIQKKEEVRILVSIKEEVQQAITSREKIRDTYQGKKDQLSSALDKLYSDTPQSISDEECYAIFQSHMTSWNPFTVSTLEELVTTGKISILSNDELRKLLLTFRNLGNSNQSRVEKVLYEAIVLVDEFPLLIERNWDPSAQESQFTCNAEAMKKNKYFLAQLQSNWGRMTSPIGVASLELEMLNKILKQLDEEIKLQ